MKIRPIKAILFIYIFILTASVPLLSQESGQAVNDTSRVRESRKKSDLEGPVTYEAQEIDNFITERKTILLGRARVDYLNMWIKAAKIIVDWENDLLTAVGVPDTVWMREENSTDSVQVFKMTGLPEFSEDGQITQSDSMVYHFKTRKGRVVRGRTAHEDGFYSGKVIKMVKPQTLHISDATFTTCDKEDDPHFHFWFNKMKVEVNNKVERSPHRYSLAFQS